MSKIYIQGTFGAYSHLAALEIDPNAEVVPCKTFDECFLKTSSENGSRMLIPESNRITGNIGIEYLIFQYRLNIYAEHFQKIEHNLLGQPGANLNDIKDVFSHSQGLSQCSNFIKKNNFAEHIRADTAGSAEAISKKKFKSEAAIASKLSAKIYKLAILAPNIENEKGNTTRFLIMGKSIQQPENQKDKKFVSLFSNPIKGKTVVLVGTGSLGSSMAKLMSPLGVNIIGVNKRGRMVDGCSKIVTIDKIDSVLADADFLYLAVPGTRETKNLINRERLNKLKSTCGIVNIGRQSVMDYDALSEKLKKNEIAGAILDVFSHEPLDKNSKLWDTPNLVITPHVSSDDDENYVELTLGIFFNNLKLFIENKKLTNQVDKKLGY